MDTLDDYPYDERERAKMAAYDAMIARMNSKHFVATEAETGKVSIYSLLPDDRCFPISKSELHTLYSNQYVVRWGDATIDTAWLSDPKRRTYQEGIIRNTDGRWCPVNPAEWPVTAPQSA